MAFSDAKTRLQGIFTSTVSEMLTPGLFFLEKAKESNMSKRTIQKDSVKELNWKSDKWQKGFQSRKQEKEKIFLVFQGYFFLT